MEGQTKQQLYAALKGTIKKETVYQGSKIVLVRSYLRVPEAAGQVKFLISLLKIKFFPIYANNYFDAGQVPIFRYFEACILIPNMAIVYTRLAF